MVSYFESHKDVFEAFSSKKHHGQEEGFYLPFRYDDRYKDHSYLQSSNGNTRHPEVVLKIVSTAIGKNAVRNLLHYIAKSMPSAEQSQMVDAHPLLEIEQGGETILENERGELLIGSKARLKELSVWAKDFQGGAHYEKQAWKDAKLREFKKELASLETHALESGMDDATKARMEWLREAIYNQRYVENGESVDLRVFVPRDSIHMVLSVGGKVEGSSGLERSTVAVRQFLAEYFGAQGHRYVFCAHTDTDNLHYHVIIKNRNVLTGRNLTMDRADLFMLRRAFAQHLTQLGIVRNATLRKDRSQLIGRIAEGIVQLREQKSWYQHRLSHFNGKQSVNAFAFRSRLIRRALRLEQLSKRALEHEPPGEKRERLQNDLKVLRNFREGLKTVTPEEFIPMQEATLAYFKNDQNVIHQKIAQMASMDADHIQGQLLGKRDKQVEALSSYLKRHQQSLQEALQQSKSPAIRKQLQGLLKEIPKIGRSIKKVREFDA